ncbi:MAG: circularly permuted type 2 ATP-grasp protein [Planctomycetota bacterium]
MSLLGYLVAPDRFDACRSADGSIRSGWNHINEFVSQVGAEGLNERSEQLQKLIRDNGATFTVEGDHQRQGRPWKLATIPHSIEIESWSVVERGLRQRARLLEAVLNDLLSEQSLIRQRVIPPELLWANPAFARVMHGLPACIDDEGKSQRLVVTGTDLVRSNDGSWSVIGDRTRAPSGLGYLLENRIVTSQVLSQLVRQCNVRRVASFFFKLRSRLQSLAPRQRDNPRVAILTPGAQSYRYFEDAYLARYLGYTLVQGSDLAVRGNQLNLKTLGGLLPVEVLWRHISDLQSDPLELAPDSSEGVTGLLRTVRRGSVSIANSIGSELAQMPALAPFLPSACKLLFDEDLLLPSVDTYWCGGTKELQHVTEHLEEFVIRSAFVINRETPIIGAELSADEKQEWIARIRANPKLYVAQQSMKHATTPVWTGSEFAAWHVSLRSFQVLDGDDVEVLPGGLARASPNENDLLKSPTSGQLTLDCWVTDHQPAAWEVSLLPDPHSAVELQRGGSELPSRVAEQLFWLGRYVERCESIARLLRTTLKRLASEDDSSQLSEVPKLTAALAAIGQIEPDYVIDGLGGTLPALDIVLPASVFSRDQPEGLQSAARSMVFNAMAVRDRLSTDAYRIITKIGEELKISPPVQTGEIGPAIERLNRLITDLLAFAGLSSESMTRTHGWRFLQLGRRIERTHQTAELISASLISSSSNERSICEAILETTDGLMTYHSRYMNMVRPILVLDLLVTDETNPRSIAFQIGEIDRAVNELPRDRRAIGLQDDQLHSRRLLDEIQTLNVLSLADESNGRRLKLLELLNHVIDGLPGLSDAIVAQFFFHTSTTQSLTGSRAQSGTRADTDDPRPPREFSPMQPGDPRQ